MDYLYQYYDVRNDYENKKKVLDVLHSMKKDVPKTIVDECEL
jgi:hypothetical protein